MAIFDFWSKQFYLLLIFKLLWYFLPSFKAADLSVQEKQFKNDFQDGGHGGHLGLTIGTILIFFI